MKIETDHPKVFFDIVINKKPVGRIVLELFEDRAPKACANFEELLPKFRNTYFHRVIKNFMIQGGDIIYAQADKYDNTLVGSGSRPDGKTFEDENTSEDMEQPFMLCMANSGINTNGSQFFITTAPTPHLKGLHTVFGKVKHGKSVVREIERVQSTPENVPIQDELPVIAECGKWSDGDPIPIFNACYDQIGGDIYEEFPDDDEHIIKGSSKSVFEASSIIKDSGAALLKAGEIEKAILKFKKCLRYVMEYIPDDEQEPEFYQKFYTLRKKVYLNLTLAWLKLKDYSKCGEYCSILLDMKLTDQERSKTLYRLGACFIASKKYEQAVTTLEQAKKLSNDAAIDRDLQKAENLLAKQRDHEKARYAKFFSA